MASSTPLLRLGAVLGARIGDMYIGGPPLTKRDWAAIALYALDQAGVDVDDPNIAAWARDVESETK
ncbi:MAG TPA: hypothetical protein VI172_16045 [Candidatus Dormibacteraeota bacterium]